MKKASQQQLVTNIVSGIAAVGQFSSSITTLTNGFKVLGDETLSTGEKILQFLTSFGFGIGLFVSSGSKIVSTFTAINGAINFSVLDGWWAEGYNMKNGWTIGKNAEYENYEVQDNYDCESLYNTLENKIMQSIN